MGRKLASFDRNGLAPVGLSNQRAESHWTTLVLKNGRAGKYWVDVLAILEGNYSRYGEMVNIVTIPVTQCRHKLSSNAVIPVHR